MFTLPLWSSVSPWSFVGFLGSVVRTYHFTCLILLMNGTFHHYKIPPFLWLCCLHSCLLRLITTQRTSFLLVSVCNAAFFTFYLQLEICVWKTASARNQPQDGMRHAGALSGKPGRDHPEEGEVARWPGEPADHDEGMTPAKNKGKEEVWPQFFKDPIEVPFSSILSVQWFCEYAELFHHYNSVLKLFHHP